MGSRAKFEGRAFIYDTGDCPEFTIWCNELASMTAAKLSSDEWVLNHFQECYSEKDLRELFGLPPTGNYQVLFNGELEGVLCGSPMDGQEWDEHIDLEIKATEKIPEDYMSFKCEEPNGIQ